MEQVGVRINEERLLANLRYAFTNRSTVLTELMQNARRAKASFVAIDYDSDTETLVVRDDGVGIADFQALFTVGESGWDAATVAAEHAFGMGFMKSLYSARHCTVRSRGKVIAFDSAAALRGEPIEVRVTQPTPETVVRLEGVKLTQLEQRMKELASGFAIPVIVNGVELERPFALDRLPFVDTEIGHVHLVGTEDGKAAAATLLLLQGFPIYGEARYATGWNIVHLDPARFAARLPDRDMLIDEEEGVRAVERFLQAMWRTRLIQAKQALSSAAFVERYFEAAQRWGARDLFDDVPLLPGALFAHIAGYPVQEGYAEAEYLAPLPGLVRREQIEGGQLTLVALSRPDGENGPLWMFAKAKGRVVLVSGCLAAGHWLWPFVADLDEAKPQVEIVGERIRAPLQGQWVAPEVVICEAYRVRLGEETVEIRDEAVFLPEGVIVVPAGEGSGAAVEQCSSFIDEHDHWHGEDRDADVRALQVLIRRLRACDPAEAMRSLILDLRLEDYPSLRGRTFALTVGAQPAGHEVHMLA